MVRRLDMDKTQGIEQLFASGMTKRKIARTLGINRKSVDRHLAGLQSKGASAAEALTGEAPPGQTIQKGPKRPPGRRLPNWGLQRLENRALKRFRHVANVLGTAIRSLPRSNKA